MNPNPSDPFEMAERRLREAEERLRQGGEEQGAGEGAEASLLAAGGGASVQRLRWLLEIDRVMGSTLEPERLLEYILDRAVELTGAERGFIVLQDAEGQLHFQAARDSAGRSIPDPRSEISSAVLEEVARTRAPVVVQDALSDGRFFDRSASILALELRSILAVPLLALDGMLGAVYLDHRTAAGRFQREDLELLETFSRQAAVSLRNALLHLELETARQRLEQEAESLRGEVSGRYVPFQGIIGRCEGMREVLELVRKVADSASNVLILGENGTGKELVARAIHYGGRRRGGPFVAVNCAALPETLLESELFGIERGTATGVERKVGRFEQAHGGTLFLDEVGDMSPVTQSKVLRAIQERSFQRLGGRRPIRLDIRLIAATNQDLREGVRAGRFREDLYYRLNVIPIALPPLRERQGDVELLVDHFLAHFCAESKRPLLRLEEEARSLLLAYPWPGNVRQLENTTERLALLVEGEAIRPADLPEEIRRPESPRSFPSVHRPPELDRAEQEFPSRHKADAGPGIGAGAATRPPSAPGGTDAGGPAPIAGAAEADPPLTIRQLAARHAREVLERTGGNKKEACRLLDISFKTLQSYLRQE